MVSFLIAVFPSAGVLFLFWIVIRALLQADRRERVAQARLEAAQDRALAVGGTDGRAPLFAVAVGHVGDLGGVSGGQATTPDDATPDDATPDDATPDDATPERYPR